MINLEYIDAPSLELIKPIAGEQYLQHKQLQVRAYHNIYLLPKRGLFYANGNMVEGSLIQDITTLPPIDVQLYSTTITKISEAVYMGYLRNTWGHVYTDSIRRMWWIDNISFSSYRQKPLVYIQQDDTLGENQKAILKCICNLEEMQKVDKPILVETLYIPDSCFSAHPTYLGQPFYTPEFLQMRDKIITKLSHTYIHTYIHTYMIKYIFHVQNGQIGELVMENKKLKIISKT